MFQKLGCFFALSLAFAFPAQAAETGKPAPEFSVKDIAGHEQSIAQYKGKIVVLEWTNPGCPFVKKHYESQNMQKLQEYALGKGVIWLSINSSAEGKQGHLSAAEAKENIAAAGAHGTGYILDSKGVIGKLYSAKTTPHMYVINKDGVLAYQGAIDDKPTPDKADITGATNYVRAAVDSLLAGAKVATESTRAYGCGVKYAD